jgi:hypothetical protein
LKATYEKEMQKINDAELSMLVSEQDKYIASLRNLQKQMQQAGKLDPVLTIGKEIDRFAGAKNIEPDNISADIPAMAALQNAYIKGVEKFPLEQARKIVALAQNYEKALAGLQESLTKKNDIQGAIEAKAEKEKLANNDEVMRARALITGAESKAESEKQAKTAEKVAPPQNAGDKGDLKAGAEAKANVKKKYTGSAEKRVRQRFDDLVKSILKQDFTAATELVNPEFVESAGKDGVRRAFVGIFPFLKLADDPHRKLSVGSVKVDDDAGTGTLVPRLWAGNQWHELSANKWIETEGDWYLDLQGSSGEGMSPSDLKRLEKEESKVGVGFGVRKPPFRRPMGRK